MAYDVGVSDGVCPLRTWILSGMEYVKTCRRDPAKPLVVSVIVPNLMAISYPDRLSQEYSGFPREVQLIKAALLYGDMVKLISPAISYLDGEYLAGIDDSRPEDWFDEIVAKQESYEQWKVPPGPKVDAVLGSNSQLRMPYSFGDSISLEDRLSTLEAFELKDALNSGLVKILPCHRWRFFPFPLVVNERFLRLAKANIDDPLAFPLIDKYGWREFIEQTLAGRLKSAEPDFRTRGKALALASYSFSRLPAFESATVREIVDIRRELRPSLSKFRAATLDFASEISETVPGLEFDAQLSNVWMTRIGPALEDIHENIQQSFYIRELINESVRSSITPVSAAATSAIAMAAGEKGAITGAIAAATAVTVAAGRAFISQQEKRRETRMNKLYMLYQIDTRLKR